MALAALNAIVRAVLDPRCASCRGPLPEPLDSPVCSRCWIGVARITPPYCACCGEPVAPVRADEPCARCDVERPACEMARSATIYDGPMRDIVHAFKYAGRRTLARDLARLMRAAGEEVLEGAHGLVPVPLHPRRELARGFNQADDLARRLGAPVWPVLRRRRYSRPQAGRSRSDRHAGVHHAFAIARVPALHRGGRSLAGATVVLIDDVMTTGATIEACAEILLAAGVRSVRALTAARAVAAPHRPRLPPQPPSNARHR